MKLKLVAPIVLALGVVTGCKTTPVVFTTQTSMGLDVSGTAQMPNKVSFSFNRFEGAIVPRKTNGEAHSVYGGLDSDIKFFGGQTIKQTFATGKAAMLATGSDTSGINSQSSNSDQDALVFVTSTTYGLHLTAGEQQMSPNLLMGYRRTEAALIPIPDPGQEVRSVYADLLINSSTATTNTEITTNFSALRGVRIKQSFATGRAADALATDEGIREKLDQAAGTTSGKLDRLRARGVELSESVAHQVNRLKEDQLNLGGEALKKSGLALVKDEDMTAFKIQTGFEKSRLLRDVAKGLKSPKDIAALEKYLVELRDIK